MIWQKKSGLRLPYNLGKENGKPKYRHVYARSESELKNKAAVLKLSINKGIDILAGNDSFKTWADQWIQVKALEVSSGQLSTYKANLKHLEGLNDVPITKIKTAHIQHIIVMLCKENPRTKKLTAKKILLGIKSTASQIFDLAIQNRVIDYNPRGIPITISMITPHWLRHTYAAALYFAGVDVLTAKDLLGHSDIKTTLEFYTHLNEKHKKKNIEKLNEYLKNA